MYQKIIQKCRRIYFESKVEPNEVTWNKVKYNVAAFNPFSPLYDTISHGDNAVQNTIPMNFEFERTPGLDYWDSEKCMRAALGRTTSWNGDYKG